MTLYESGLEPVTSGDGWAVFTGCDGDDPTFVAFFMWEADAEKLVHELRRDTNTGVSHELAILTDDMGIVAANDVDIRTHADLRQRIVNERAARMAES